MKLANVTLLLFLKFPELWELLTAHAEHKAVSSHLSMKYTNEKISHLIQQVCFVPYKVALTFVSCWSGPGCPSILDLHRVYMNCGLGSFDSTESVFTRKHLEKELHRSPKVISLILMSLIYQNPVKLRTTSEKQIKLI